MSRLKKLEPSLKLKSNSLSVEASFEIANDHIDLADLQLRIDALVREQNHFLREGNMDEWSRLDAQHRRLCERRNYLKVQLASRRVSHADFDFSLLLEKELKTAERTTINKLEGSKRMARDLETKIRLLQEKLHGKTIDINTNLAKLQAIRGELNARSRDSSEDSVQS